MNMVRYKEDKFSGVNFMNKIVIRCENLNVEAELNQKPTALKIWEALPINGRVNRWGDEIYFDIPIIMDQEKDARADVEVSELGYWPVGHAFCIFFGRTPASSGEKPRAASPVNILGRVTGDVQLFRSVKSGAAIRLEKMQE